MQSPAFRKTFSDENGEVDWHIQERVAKNAELDARRSRMVEVEAEIEREQAAEEKLRLQLQEEATRQRLLEDQAWMRTGGMGRVEEGKQGRSTPMWSM
jgi:hypothetical protein